MGCVLATSTKLNEYDTAEQAFVQALRLNPTSQDIYIAFLHLYLVTDRSTEAEALCDEGIVFAQAHQDAPWASELGTLLNEAKSVIKTDVH